MSVDVDILVKALPLAKRENLEKYVGPLKIAFLKYNIDTINRQAAFLAQCAHESANFSATVENLNYSKESLVKVWPKHFPTLEFAAAYHRQPEKIANRAYRNRMGNGDEASGDGWRYRGRGLIQLTGKNNYEAYGKAVAIDFVKEPELMDKPVNHVLSAAWFWETNGLNAFADKEDIVGMTKRINGGTHGLQDRLSKYDKIKKVLTENGLIGGGIV